MGKQLLLLMFFLGFAIAGKSQVNRERADFETQVDAQIDSEADLEKRILEPNPTLGRLQIDVSQYDFAFYDLQVRNIIGKVLWSQTIHQPVQLLDLTELRKGSYFFSICAPDGEYLEVLRLVIVNP